MIALAKENQVLQTQNVVLATFYVIWRKIELLHF